MDDTFLNDLELDALSDDELEETVRNLCHAMFYAIKGGSVIVSINGKAATPSCVSGALRAMADLIEQNGIPKGVVLVRKSLLN